MPRVYAIETEDELTLVTANGQAQALGHVVKGKYKIRTATAMDVVEYIAAGGVVEDATGEHAQTGLAQEALAEEGQGE